MFSCMAELKGPRATADEASTHREQAQDLHQEVAGDKLEDRAKEGPPKFSQGYPNASCDCSSLLHCDRVERRIKGCLKDSEFSGAERAIYKGYPNVSIVEEVQERLVDPC